MWKEIKNSALVMINNNNKKVGYDMPALDQWILETGYGKNKNPHKLVQDLIYCYAANLRNIGQRGIDKLVFAEIIENAALEIIFDNEINKTDNKSFANNCYLYLKNNPSKIPKTSSNINYYDCFKNIAENGESFNSNNNKHIINNFLESIVDFINFLVQNYNGSAIDYHDSFLISTENNFDFILQKFNEIKKIPMMGAALGMNFLKDSQVPSLINKKLEDLIDNPICSFVKPDVHLLRFMFKISGRSRILNIADNNIIDLEENDLVKYYSKKLNLDVDNLLLNMNLNLDKNLICKFKCILDVHLFARNNTVSPLEVDRILYLIGSGKIMKGLKLKDKDRYLNIFSIINKN